MKVMRLLYIEPQAHNYRYIICYCYSENLVGGRINDLLKVEII